MRAGNAGQPAAAADHVEPGPAAVETSGQRGAKAPCLPIEARAQFFFRGDHHLRGSRGRRRANIRDEIGDREIRLVTDGGDDRYGAPDDGARNRLLVEGPQVLSRSTATPDDHDVDAGHAADGPDGIGDLSRCAFALHPRRPDDEVDVGMAAGEDLDDIAERRSGERRDDADLRRQRRQRPLARKIEEALGLELLLQLLERQLQRAETLRLKVVAEQLILALRLVDGQPPARHHAQSVFGLELQIAHG